MARLDARLEVRLDRQTYQLLEQRAVRDGISVGQLVRQAISRELAGDDRPWRLQALQRAFALGTPVPEDPAELARELDRVYAGGEAPIFERDHPDWAK